MIGVSSDKTAREVVCTAFPRQVYLRWKNFPQNKKERTSFLLGKKKNLFYDMAFGYKLFSYNIYDILSFLI